MIKKDGHIHTNYCPHGTPDSLEEYVQLAINKGFNEISFTEHAPLPEGFTDPTPLRDSAMQLSSMDDYIRSIEHIKKKYSNDLRINIGLEIDYIENYEQGTKDFLNEYGKYLDDSILSVHFLHISDRYYCIDYDDKTFGEMVKLAGSLQTLHHTYYETVLKSIRSSLGQFKPKRIGHLTLAHKFQKKFPVTFDIKNIMINILSAIKEEQLEVDFNVAGLRKELCGDIYPLPWIAELAYQQKIPLIYGSDAHSARDLGKDYEKYISFSPN
ncbi:histidinol-phosphatase HisJ [Metabacillus fastidiosus]|uniref:histidinol-phosphatase HisJ n=1 Tax=Metabacillus fastidiosus TaxID=1458 RepID=UPI000A63F791|nr:histidinol-phosphatase HisJ [Metabacillus fastidiosus]